MEYNEFTEKWTFFALVCTIWMVDNFTSIYYINKFPEYIYEANPIGNFFFSFGFPGYVANFIFCISLIAFGIFVLPELYTNLWHHNSNEEYKEQKVRIYRALYTGLAFGAEVMVIASNYRLWSALG